MVAGAGVVGFGGGVFGAVVGGGSDDAGVFAVPGRGGFFPGVPGIAAVAALDAAEAAVAAVVASGGGTTGSPIGASPGGASGCAGADGPGGSVAGVWMPGDATAGVDFSAPTPTRGPSFSTTAAPAARHSGTIAQRTRRLPDDPTLTRGDDAVNGAEVTFPARAYPGLEPDGVALEGGVAP